jgi:hypothetical protein
MAMTHVGALESDSSSRTSISGPDDGKSVTTPSALAQLGTPS